MRAYYECIKVRGLRLQFEKHQVVSLSSRALCCCCCCCCSWLVRRRRWTEICLIQTSVIAMRGARMQRGVWKASSFLSLAD